MRAKTPASIAATLYHTPPLMSKWNPFVYGRSSVTPGRAGTKVRFCLSPLRMRGSRVVSPHKRRERQRQRHWMPDRAGHDRRRRGGQPCVPFGFASFDSAVATLRTSRTGRTGARVRFGLSPLRMRGSRVVSPHKRRERQRHWMPDRAGHDRRRRGGQPCVPFGFASFGSAVATLRTGRTGAKVRFCLSPLRMRGARVVSPHKRRERQRHWMPDRAGHDRGGGEGDLHGMLAKEF